MLVRGAGAAQPIADNTTANGRPEPPASELHIDVPQPILAGCRSGRAHAVGRQHWRVPRSFSAESDGASSGAARLGLLRTSMWSSTRRFWLVRLQSCCPMGCAAPPLDEHLSRVDGAAARAVADASAPGARAPRCAPEIRWIGVTPGPGSGRRDTWRGFAELRDLLLPQRAQDRAVAGEQERRLEFTKIVLRPPRVGDLLGSCACCRGSCDGAPCDAAPAADRRSSPRRQARRCPRRPQRHRPRRSQCASRESRRSKDRAGRHHEQTNGRIQPPPGVLDVHEACGLLGGRRGRVARTRRHGTCGRSLVHGVQR